MGKEKYFHRTLIAIVFLAVLSTLVVSALASQWRQLSDDQRNGLILQEARNNLGRYGGQCKAWVQNLVYKVSGNTLWLPQNFHKIGDPYHLAKWREDQPGSRYCQIIWQGCYYCPLRFTGWGIRAGNIIQFRHTAGGVTPHTAIIEAIFADRLQVIDSNWRGDSIVRRHNITIQWFWRYVKAWTVYQLK